MKTLTFLDIASNPMLSTLVIRMITLGFILLVIIGFSFSIPHIISDFYLPMAIIAIIGSYFITKYKLIKRLK
jgi:LytS/YehU family sensor histidine kinase